MHKHHIIPRHIGGTDGPSNLIELTVEDHAEAHRLLYEQYGRWQDELAWKALSGRIGKEEIIREKISLSRKGIHLTKDHKTKLHNGRRGNKNSEYHRTKIVESNKSRIYSIETREKLRVAQLGKKQVKKLVLK